MSSPRTLRSGSGKEEWEEWEDDEVLTPITTRDGPLLEREAGGPPTRQPSQRSTHRIRRLKSRQRQKAQNAKFGIKLVTDMSKFRQQQHIAQQMRPPREHRETRTGKFVDAAALKALEGAPSDNEDDSILGWLKRKPTKGKKVERLAPEAAPQADLSPSERPIVIGFAMPSDSDVVISPQTAVVETPIEFPRYFTPGAKPASSNQPVSAWSPDTEDGMSPRGPERGYVPAVPSIPSHYRAADLSPLARSETGDDLGASRGAKKSFRDTVTTPIYVSDDDDMATPVTLFEEDGSPATIRPKKSLRVKGRQRSATNGSSRSQGWWDQVTSPFGPPTPATPQSPGATQAKPDQSQAWWKDTDKKKPLSPVRPQLEAGSSRAPQSPPRLQHTPPEIIISDVSSTLPSSSMATSSTPVQIATTASEKPRMLAEEVRTPGELPPPYSPPKNHNIRYRAVFPPGHPLNDMFPPSPGPVPPGLSQTMTSQGAIGLADVPLTPPPAAHQPRLPDRPLGSFVPADQYVDASGYGPRQKAERRRRRHEKEDAVAWKAGRMWHGRGCFPLCGCIGRPGREGRTRRRWCLGLCVAALLLTILGVVLGVTLSKRVTAPADMPSPWLNLTDFPPIPTGIATVIGPDSDSTTACVQPPTLWTCSLPKEQAGSVSPFDASQPSFVIQIQFDNSTRQLWDVTGIPPTPTPTNKGKSLPLPSSNATITSTSTSATATSIGGSSRLRRRTLDTRDDPSSSLDLRSDPAPPSFQEMFFLGNTTDNVVSAAKAGEPTPFYISILHSVNDTVGPNLLTRRDNGGNLTAGQGLINASDIAPPPLLNPDGTGAPAVLLGFPTQQPLRLYDRGLPTERYGFYSYFNKTTYVTSVAALSNNGNNGGQPVTADLAGGSLETQAKFIVTWLSVRYKVEIWTRMLAANSTRLIGNGNGGGPSADNSTQPGTFPYPVTVTLDTHGGQPGKKFVFVRGVDASQHIVLDDAKFVLNNINTTGVLINPSGDFNPSFGGMDGGTGGCKCEYRNFVAVNGGS